MLPSALNAATSFIQKHQGAVSSARLPSITVNAYVLITPSILLKKLATIARKPIKLVVKHAWVIHSKILVIFATESRIKHNANRNAQAITTMISSIAAMCAPMQRRAIAQASIVPDFNSIMILKHASIAKLTSINQFATVLTITSTLHSKNAFLAHQPLNSSASTPVLAMGSSTILAKPAIKMFCSRCVRNVRGFILTMRRLCA